MCYFVPSDDFGPKMFEMLLIENSWAANRVRVIKNLFV